jgi:DNA (cytosine-5)-methyltransferase 1
VTRPRLLDFFSGAGGCARGYQRAGFYVVGVDIKPQPRYAGDEFHRADALEVLRILVSGGTWEGYTLSDFAAVHASPPCQHDSVASKSHNGRPQDHPDLIAPTRELLAVTRLPYVIENVAGARRKLRHPIMLCGTMFPPLRVTRHRYFECHGFAPGAMPRHGAHSLHYTRDKRKPHYGALDEMEAFVSVNGGGNCSVRAAADAMGIDWMATKHDLNEAIPPPYTEFVGRRLMAQVGRGTMAHAA